MAESPGRIVDLARHTRKIRMRGKRVLLADNRLSMRAATASLLRNDGFDVSIAADGYELLELLLQSRVDLVMARDCVAGLSGLEAFRIYCFGTTQRVPWILLCDRADSANAELVTQSGVAAVAQAGEDPAALLDVVRRLTGVSDGTGLA